MKKVAMFVATFMIAGSLVARTPAFAASTAPQSFNVSAQVNSTLSLNVLLKKNSSTGASISTMDFGSLSDVGTGTLRSSATGSTGTGSAVAMLTANGGGLAYTITQTGTTLTSGANTLPTGACTVVPVYAAADNGGAAKPASATVGTAGTWSAVNKVLYDSGTDTTLKTVQANYSITDDPAAGATTGVPTSQAPGTYAATVSFTLTQK